MLLSLVYYVKNSKAVCRGATRRDGGLILVSAGYAHPCLFEDLISPTSNLKNPSNSVGYRFNYCVSCSEVWLRPSFLLPRQAMGG